MGKIWHKCRQMAASWSWTCSGPICASRNSSLGKMFASYSFLFKIIFPVHLLSSWVSTKWSCCCCFFAACSNSKCKMYFTISNKLSHKSQLVYMSWYLKTVLKKPFPCISESRHRLASNSIFFYPPKKAINTKRWWLLSELFIVWNDYLEVRKLISIF